MLYLTGEGPRKTCERMAHIKLPEGIPGILGPMAFSPETGEYGDERSARATKMLIRQDVSGPELEL